MIANEFQLEENIEQDKVQKQQRLDVQEKQQNVQQQITCRICLQEMTPQQTFTVCLCKGANGNVHQHCLTQWARKAQKYRQSYDRYFYDCEICKHKIYLKVDKHTKCLTPGEIRFMGNGLCCTLTSATILLLGLGMLAVSLYLRAVSAKSSRLLFDVVFGFAVAIVVLDVVISVLYFIVQIDIIVTGVVVIKYGVGKEATEFKETKQKVLTQKIVPLNIQGIQKQSQTTAIMLSKQKQNLNISQTSLLYETTETRNIVAEEKIDQIRMEDLSKMQLEETNEFRSSSIKQPKSIDHTNTSATILQNENANCEHENNELEQQNEQQKPMPSKLFFEEPQLQQTSMSSVQEHSNIIKVKSILCHTRHSYHSDPLSNDNISTSQIQPQNNPSHNQTPSISQNIPAISSLSKSKKHRNTEPRLFAKVKETQSFEIGENILECGKQIDDGEIYFPNTQLKQEGKFTKQNAQPDQQKQTNQ